jgi:Protein of unknown function (DUF3105)
VKAPGIITAAAVAAAIALAACGEEESEPSASTSTTSTVAGGIGSCGAIEEVEVPQPVQHENREFTATDYETNPPAGGDHTDAALGAGTFYPEPPPLGQTVHLLEHGAVVGWTNGVSPADRTAIEEEFDELFKEGYYQLAVVENADMEVPFALSAWGALQRCEEVDVAAIRPFVEEWYASPKSPESELACQGPARELPNC